VNDLFEVIYEDPGLLVVNKPAGLVCHPTKSDERSSLIGRVRLYLGNSEGRLVNRLDRETSGLVLVAKSNQVAGELGKLIEATSVRKEYFAIVHGSVALDELTINAPSAKTNTARSRSRIASDPMEPRRRPTRACKLASSAMADRSHCSPCSHGLDESIRSGFISLTPDIRSSVTNSMAPTN
jgi:23S rRNA-/tRNA-specific pseudouridylate synthase